MYKIIATCIERTTVLGANTTCVMREYKAGEGLLAVHDHVWLLP